MTIDPPSFEDEIDPEISSEPEPPKSSLIARFAASTAALAIVVAGLAILFSVAINRKLIWDAMDGTVRGYSQTLAKHIRGSSDPAFWQSIAREHRVALLVQTPEIERAFGPDGQPATARAVLDSKLGIVPIDIMSEDGTRVFFSWNLSHFARLHDPLVMGHLLLLIPVIGATYWFQRSQLRPLQWLHKGVDAVGAGDFKTQVPVVRMDEIGQVASAFNKMTRQVERMVADRERLLADVSHELRSPLARVKVALELMPVSDKKQSIQNDVREMETLISVLLERERLRALTDRHAMLPVDLGTVVRQVTGLFSGRDPGVAFSATQEPLIAEADVDLVRLLAQNLIENALKFSLPDSDPVEVTLTPAADGVELAVADDGPGIAERDLAEVFKPFVKLDPARGHRTGYGLGLNLCWRIVQAHGGSIRMLPNKKRGNRAVVSLPKAR